MIDTVIHQEITRHSYYMENYNYAFRLFFLSNEGDLLFPSILLLSDVQFLCSVQFASLLPPEEG